jgi:hypothetical protein
MQSIQKLFVYYNIAIGNIIDIADNGIWKKSDRIKFR